MALFEGGRERQGEGMGGRGDGGERGWGGEGMGGREGGR